MNKTNGNWEQIYLSDVLHIKHGYAFQSKYFSNSGKYVLLTPGNFFEEGGLNLRSDKLRYYFGNIPSGFILRRNDLLVVMTEQAEGLLGSSGLIPIDDKYLHNQRLGLIDYFDVTKIDKGFVYHLFNCNHVRYQIRSTANGTKVRHTSPSRIYEVKIFLPPLPTQRKIAAILSAFDDLIENNLRRIKILEEITRKVYTEWFVEFRFPGHEKVNFVDSPMGRIPEGWEAKKVKDTISRIKAKVVYDRNNVLEIGDVIVIDQSVNKYLGFHNNDADLIASPSSPIVIFGDHTCKMQIMVKPFSIGPNVVPFTAKEGQSTYYLYSLINSLVETREYKRHWTELTNKEVIYSYFGITKQFDKQVEPIFQQIDIFNNQILVLRHTRDLLLPKLISGELDVSDIDIKTGDID